MRLRAAEIAVLDEREISQIIGCALGILEQVGMVVESDVICKRLADHGVQWDGAAKLHFPSEVVERYIATHRTPQTSAAEKPFSSHGFLGSYPTRYYNPHTGQVQHATAQTVADLTRLADYIPNIDGIGSCGVPSDVPPLLQPLWMRLISWRYAEKMSNSYVVWDHRICPYIEEMCHIAADMEPQNGTMDGRYFRAENYIISPLHYAREEAMQFEYFYERGHRVNISSLLSMGAAAPVTIAGAIALGMAEALASSFIMSAFYGDAGFYCTNPLVPLDMRSGCMCYGRPESMLASLACLQISRHLQSADGLCLKGGTAAKEPDVEAGLWKSLAAGMRLGLMNDVSWHFGITSVDELYDPRLMVIENEFVDALKRFGRGFEVNEKTLAFDVIKEVGPGGSFLGHPHTAEHFRDEWLPDFFNGQLYEGWKLAGSPKILDRAQDRVLEILKTHHPRGIKPQTEEKLLKIIDRAAAELGIAEYRRPAITGQKEKLGAPETVVGYRS